MNCRYCKTIIKHEFVDLGYSPPSNAFLSKTQLASPETYFPLRIMVCEKCFLVQIEEYAKHDAIFNEEYIYFSSYSKSWLAHSKRYVDMMLNRFALDRDSLVIEIASNDGYLLQYFKDKAIPVLGIEPTANTASVAEKKGIESVVEFFSESLAHKLVEEGKSADLILGNNVLAHVPDINDFVKGMKIALKPNGIITMEFPHLLQLIINNQFDTIYHEHYSYLSFSTVKQVFEQSGFVMFDVEEVPTHGGSLRIFAKHIDDESKEISVNVKALLDKEDDHGLNDINTYLNFQERSIKVKNDFLKFLIETNQSEKIVVGYGAAAKGNTLINYAGIKKDLIQFVVDASPHKQNKFLPGAHIPVYDEAKLKMEKPDYVIILPWNIREEIELQLDYIRSWGGKFVVAVPSLEIF